MNYNSLLACDLMSGTGFLGLLYIGLYKNIIGLDLCILLYLFFGLSIYFYGRITQNQLYYEIYHYLLIIIFVMMPFITANVDLLFWHLTFIFLTMATRRIFDGCIISQVERNPLEHKTKLTEWFNSDIIFTGLGLITIYNLYSLSN